MIGYYDLVLVLIPVSLLGVSGTLHGVGIDLTTAVPLGAAVAVALIGHAMFVNAPVGSAEASASTPVSTSTTSTSTPAAD